MFSPVCVLVYFSVFSDEVMVRWAYRQGHATVGITKAHKMLVAARDTFSKTTVLSHLSEFPL